MPGSSFGRAFRVTTAGESHGPGHVVIIDGCPPGLELDTKDLRAELARRRPGQSHLVSQRTEADEPEILSGVFEGKTTGTSLAILIRNTDAKSEDYAELADKYRPGHADAGYDAKYGRRDHRGGGRASARETVARVAAGAVAKKLIARAFGGEVLGYVVQVGDVVAAVGPEVTSAEVETLPDGSPNLVRCPHPEAAARMVELIESVRKDQDSIGGIAEIVARNVPAGLGEPVFDKLKADLAKALFSIPAVVGVELGSGFAAARLRGSAYNDPFLPGAVPPKTATNRHGGVLGGISTGMPVVLRAAVKPASSIPREQATVTRSGEATSVRVRGRHDPCLLPRFVPVAEAMVAIVLADHWLRHCGQQRACP
jgi:chorismate synthase